MFECKEVKQLWTDIFKKLEKYLMVEHIENNAKAVICGMNSSANYKILNHVLLIIKKYIYNSRCLNRPLSVIGATQMIAQCYEIEYQLAYQNACPVIQGKFVEKWRPFVHENNFQL